MTAPHSSERAKAIVDVHLLLVDRSARFLLGLRQNTGFADGLWHLPAGHLEAGEALLDGLAREAKEELGIAIDQGSATFAHLMHQPGRVAAFFLVPRWRGTPKNMEPAKCAELEWFAVEQLSQMQLSIVPYCYQALHSIVTGVPFSQFGWEEPGGRERAA